MKLEKNYPKWGNSNFKRKILYEFAYMLILSVKSMITKLQSKPQKLGMQEWFEGWVTALSRKSKDYEWMKERDLTKIIETKRGRGKWKKENTGREQNQGLLEG